MRRLGRLDRIAKGRGVVEITEEEIPDIGEYALAESLTTVGKIVDIIGPVDRPMAVIVPAENTELVPFLGERLYVRETPHQS